MTNTVYDFILSLVPNATPGYESQLESIAGFAKEGYLSSAQRKVVRTTAAYQKKKVPAEFEAFAEQCKASEKPKQPAAADLFEPWAAAAFGYAQAEDQAKIEEAQLAQESVPTIDTNTILSDMLMVCGEAILVASLKLRGAQ